VIAGETIPVHIDKNVFSEQEDCRDVWILEMRDWNNGEWTR
jgi:hypothetical protein